MQGAPSSCKSRRTAYAWSERKAYTERWNLISFGEENLHLKMFRKMCISTLVWQRNKKRGRGREGKSRSRLWSSSAGVFLYVVSLSWTLDNIGRVRSFRELTLEELQDCKAGNWLNQYKFLSPKPIAHSQLGPWVPLILSHPLSLYLT